MTTYYRDREVQVTSTGVRIGDHSYRLGELAQVWHRRGRRSWSAVAGRGALGLAIAIPVLLGALGVAVALLLDARPSVTIALAGGGLLIGLLALPLADVLLELVDRSYDRGSRSLEMWGLIQGREVLLLRTDNAQRFGRIYRALQRAVEHGTVAR